MRKGSAIVAGLILVLSCATVWAGGRAARLEADPGMQERIDRTVTAVVTRDPDAPQLFDELLALSGDERRSLLLQLAIYLEGSHSTEESMGGALVLHRLEFTPEEKLDAILPHLEEAGSGLRRVFTDLLGTIDRPDGGEPDFGFYEGRLGEDRQAPTQALILYMYEVSPGAALDSMARVYGQGSEPPLSEGKLRDLEGILARHEDPAAWTEEDRSRARAILEDLSRAPSWWVRLYAAATLKANPALASPEINGRLTEDPDPVVRRALAP